MLLKARCLTIHAGFFIPDYTAYNEMLGLFKNVGEFTPLVSACNLYASLSSPPRRVDVSPNLGSLYPLQSPPMVLICVDLI